jgi:hypothetical protein
LGNICLDRQLTAQSQVKVDGEELVAYKSSLAMAVLPTPGYPLRTTNAPFIPISIELDVLNKASEKRVGQIRFEGKVRLASGMSVG